MKKLLWIPLTLALSLPLSAVNYIDPYEDANTGTPEGSEYTGVFADVENHWAEAQISALFAMGLISGTSETTFSPNTTMPRSEFIVAVVRQLYPSAEFEPGTNWYSGYYETASKDGILPLTFREQYMDEKITRQEMAYIMVEALAKLGESPSQLVNKTSITDYSSISSAYQENVLAAYSLGIVKGNADGSYSPQSTANRAECVVVLLNMADSSYRPTVTFDPDPNALSDMNRLDITYTKSRDNLSYSQSDSDRPIAKVGDTVGGTTVIAHPSLATVNGMAVPYIAGVALDLGINTNSAFGTVADGWSGGGSHYNGETYYVNPKTGDGYWESQWKALTTRVVAPRAYGSTEGEASPDDYKMWTWNATDRKWVASYLYGR
ncbi:MAG: S-layer homology domain-containing protein [Eubacteriales bacterium]